MSTQSNVLTQACDVLQSEQLEEAILEGRLCMDALENAMRAIWHLASTDVDNRLYAEFCENWPSGPDKVLAAVPWGADLASTLIDRYNLHGPDKLRVANVRGALSVLSQAELGWKCLGALNELHTSQGVAVR